MPVFTNTRGYPIGAMSKRTGVSIEAIRYYERIGIMPEPDRTAGGNRQYDHDQLKRLFFIRRSREIGFSIEEIRSLLEMVDRHDFTCGEVYSMATNHLVSVKQRILALHRLQEALETMVSECSRGDVPDCPILDILFREHPLA